MSTYSFQAPAFYVRAGYIECGRRSAFPHGHDQILFVKRAQLTAGSRCGARYRLEGVLAEATTPAHTPSAKTSTLMSESNRAEQRIVKRREVLEREKSLHPVRR